MGRSTRLNDDVEKRVIDGLQAGAHLSDVAKYAGVGERTLFRWLERGKKYKEANEGGVEPEEADAKYFKFSERVNETIGAVRLRMTGRILQAADGGEGREPDWKAAAWYLERSNPENWGRRVMPEAAIALVEQTNIAILAGEAVALVEQVKARRAAALANQEETLAIEGSLE